MKPLALLAALAVLWIGCDASTPEPAVSAPAQASAAEATFPFGITLTSTGSGAAVPSRRKVCYLELGSSAVQCVTNRRAAPAGALSYDGAVGVQQVGLATGEPFDVLASLGGFRDVVTFEVGKTYQVEICGAGNTFDIEFLQRTVPDLGAADPVPGLRFSYQDGGLPGRPAQYGVGGQLILEGETEGVAEVTPIVLFVPINSGPACEF